MKARLGFVSNSSSSSFVIVGSKIEGFNLIQNYGKDIYILGKPLDEGCDYFALTKEIYDFIKENQAKIQLNWDNISFYKIMLEGEDITIKKDKLLKMLQQMPSEIDIYTFTVDYHPTESLEQFKDRYVEGGKEYES